MWRDLQNSTRFKDSPPRQPIVEPLVEFNIIQNLPILQSDGCSDANGGVVVVGDVVGTARAHATALGYTLR